jgi:hypothetical protein
MEGYYWGGVMVDFEGWHAVSVITRIAVKRECMDLFIQLEYP